MVIDYSKELKVTNLSALSNGTGAKYLVTIKGENNVLIAKEWKRKLPKTIQENEVVIIF